MKMRQKSLMGRRGKFLKQYGCEYPWCRTDVIRIVGVEKLHKTEYSVIPDQIEAGTFMFAAAAAGGDVLVKDVIRNIWKQQPPNLWRQDAKLRSSMMRFGLFRMENCITHR